MDHVEPFGRRIRLSTTASSGTPSPSRSPTPFGGADHRGSQLCQRQPQLMRSQSQALTSPCQRARGHSLPMPPTEQKMPFGFSRVTISNTRSNDSSSMYMRSERSKSGEARTPKKIGNSFLFAKFVPMFMHGSGPTQKKAKYLELFHKKNKPPHPHHTAALLR